MKLRRRWREILFLLVAGAVLLACGGADGDEESSEGDGDAEIATVNNVAEPEADLDSDGIPDSIDDDIDGDGFSNDAEGNGDTDGDGIPDNRDRDSDNDGRLDVDEGDGDADGDGIDDRLDSDSDEDGLADGADPSDQDDNSDQTIDDPDDDGIDVSIDNCPLVANPEQKNRYGDGLDGDGSDAEGDACDDTDGDEALDLVDGCPLDGTRTTLPCETENGDENASCLGMAGSADPDLVPVTFSNTGNTGTAAPPPGGMAYFGPVGDVAGLFGACVPLNPGDGSPWFICPDAMQGALPGAEIMGSSPDGVYLAVQLDGGVPSGGVDFDLGACGDESERPPTLTAAPELAAINEFARSRFTFEEASDVGELVDLEPEEVLALRPEIIVLMPADTLEAIDSQDLAAALDNNLSGLPAEYLQLLTLADLQVIEPEALATLGAEQVGLLGAAEQQFVAEVRDGLPGDSGTDGP